MPSLQFDDILNRERGKTGFVLGLGPSLGTHLSGLSRVDRKKDRYTIISCNNIDLLTPINFDYWVLAQPADRESPFNLQNAWQRYNSRPNCMLLYTDCLDLTDREWVARHLTIEYLGYDQRHWNSEHCTWGNLPGGRHLCCDGLIPGRLCIQEYFKKITGADCQYGCGDTVGIHMLAIAVILGLNPIYITGMDLDYTHGYVNNNFPSAELRISMGISSINNTPKMVARIMEDLAIIKQCAERLGVKIYDLDGNGKISQVFEHKSFDYEITG